MPDKRYKKGCGKNCVKCWINKLEHGNKLKKKNFPKKFKEEEEINNEVYENDLEEFYSKYIIRGYNFNKMEKIDKIIKQVSKTIYNKNLINNLIESYKSWLFTYKNKKIKKINSNRFINDLKYYDKNRLNRKFDKYYDYYTFECIYKN
jgi:hypothetical protein